MKLNSVLVTGVWGRRQYAHWNQLSRYVREYHYCVRELLQLHIANMVPSLGEPVTQINAYNV
jgi:hypothetical protein